MSERTENTTSGAARYLVAVRVGGENHIFSFPTEEDRRGFIEDIERADPAVEYATSEIVGE